MQIDHPAGSNSEQVVKKMASYIVHSPSTTAKEITMFELNLLQCAGVLPAQQNAVHDVTAGGAEQNMVPLLIPHQFAGNVMQPLGQTDEGQPLPPKKFSSDLISSFGQMDEPLPPPPIRFPCDAMQSTGQTATPGQNSLNLQPTLLAPSGTMQSVGQLDNGPPPPTK